MAVWRPSVLLLTATILATTTISAQQQLQLGVIFAANSSSTLMVSYTLGETDATVSSPIVGYDVPPSAYSSTASTIVSAGFYLYLSESRLQIFNNSAETLKLLHSFTLPSACSRPQLTLGRGVLSSSLVNPVLAIALAECERLVYGLFPNSNGGFRLRKLLDVSAASKASLTVLPLSDNTTIAMVTGRDIYHQFMQFSDLSGGSINPKIKYFVSGISCLESAPPLLPYGKDEVILRCPNNGPSYFCTTVACESQAISTLAGVNEVQVAFGRDIAAVLNSDSISIYSNRLTSHVCSIPITTEQLFNLTEAAILILVNSTSISLYNATTCSPIAVIPIDTSATWSIIDHQYLILTTAETLNTYNVTIFYLITGERMYSVVLTKMPLAYHLRRIQNAAPSLPSSPSLSPSPTSTYSTSSSVPVSVQTSPSPNITTFASSNDVTTTLPSIRSEPTSQPSSQTSLTDPLSLTTSADNTASLPSTSPSATSRPASTFESLPVSTIVAVLTAVAVILPVLLFIILVGILVHCTRNGRHKNVFGNSSSQQTNSMSSNGNDGIELGTILKIPTPETVDTNNITNTRILVY